MNLITGDFLSSFAAGAATPRQINLERGELGSKKYLKQFAENSPRLLSGKTLALCKQSASADQID